MSTKVSRNVLVTMLGAFIRRTDGWMPIGGMIDLLDALGVDEASVRTRVSRLKKRQWLEPDKRGTRSGYRVTDTAVRAFEAGDRVIWHARQPARLADGWCIASFSVPEGERAKRHLLRSRLAALGFGNVGSGTWIAPARMADDAWQVIDGMGLAAYTNVFVGSHVAGQDLHAMVHSTWDLDDIDERYRDFVATHRDAVDDLLAQYGVSVPPREAFVRYLTALDDWRVLPMRDPGLPRELLTDDWAGDDAAHLLERVVDKLGGPAFAFVKERLAG